MDFDDLDDVEEQRALDDEAEAEAKKAAEAAAAAAAAEERAAKEAADADAAVSAAEAAAAAASVRKLWEPIPADVWRTFPKIGDGPSGRPKNMKQFKEAVALTDPGEYWGIRFPFSPDEFRRMGPEWLTLAMHTAGTLPKDNAVEEFVSFDVKAEDVTVQDAENAKWGGAGLKILLQVRYKNGPGDLTEGMFIKMPHAYTGKNERFKNSVTSFGMDWSEVTFYNVFGGRFGDLPFKSPRMYFCDMCRKTTNFINIVEMIPYGRSGVVDVGAGEYFPAPEKYRDWALLNNGVDYYYAHARAIAQFFGWHKVTRESTDQIEQVFMDEGRRGMTFGILGAVGPSGPYNSPARDAAMSGMMKDPGTMGMIQMMGFPPQTAKGFLDMGTEFMENMAPQAFPRELVAKKNMDKFKRECEDMSKYVAEMNFWMSAIPEYFALCHPNAQVDNAFYWRDELGEMQCGLLDWGGVAHQNIPTCLGNGWMGAEPEMMVEHEPKLVKYFVDEYEKVTGFRFDCDDLHMNLKLAQAAVLFGCCANVGMLMRIFSRDVWKTVTGRKDPKIDENFLNRCYFVQLHLWLKMCTLDNWPYKFFVKWQKKAKATKK